MKHIMLSIVGMWFAFMTLVKTFFIIDALLVPNAYAPAAIGLTIFATLCIGFGYSMFLISLVDRVIPRKQTFTIALASGIAIFAFFCAEFLIEVSQHRTYLMHLYMSFDMYMRQHHGVVFAWMDFGNSQLLLASMLWWVLTGIFLLRIHSTRRSRV